MTGDMVPGWTRNSDRNRTSMPVEPASKASRRSVLRFAGCGCCALIFGSQPQTAIAAEPYRPALRLPEEIVGTPIPDSKLARDAADLAYAESPLFLFNHCMRVFAFSSFVAKAEKWDWDAEAVFVASTLHDLGLLEKFDDPSKTFEATGGDFAKSFAIDHKFSEMRAEVIRLGIARHTTRGTLDDPPSIAMVRLGAGLDVFGLGCEKISSQRLTRN
jgi:hypothetical protein